MAHKKEDECVDDALFLAIKEIMEELKPETKVTEALLSRMFTSTVKRLIAHIEAGDASPGNIANAIRILAANNITMDVSDPEEEEDNELDELLQSVIGELDDPV